MVSVIVVDDDHDTRLLFETVFNVLGVTEARTYPSLEAMQGDAHRVLRSNLAILDVNLGRDLPSGVDAFAWLRESNYQGRIVFLTGHARTHPLVVKAAEAPGIKVFEKPIAFTTIEGLITQGP